MPHAPQVTPLDAPDAVRGTVIEQQPPQARHQPTDIASGGGVLHGGAMAEACLLNRVGRMLQDLSAGRGVADSEIRQHAADCTSLMEQAYARYEEHQNPADREEAVLWMHRRDEALRSLSPAFKAAREAEIQQAIARGTGCYFMDQADADRARAAGRVAGA